MSPTRSARTNMRAWSWVRIDGRNVVAIPTQQQIRLYDSDDFILLSTIAPSGHTSAIAKVRWSAFHAKLASLSATQLVIHAPQLVQSDDASSDSAAPRKARQQTVVRFRAQWQLPLPQDGSSGGIHSFSFSRCAERLLFSDRGGIGILDIHNHASSSSGSDDAIPIAQVLWRSTDHAGAGNEIVKFSPSEYVLSSLQAGESRLKVWRLATTCSDATSQPPLPVATGSQRDVVCVDELAHPDPIVYYSWKPANTQLQSARELDGYHKAQWFEPPRVLLTCSICRVIRIWTERDADGDSSSLHGTARDGIPLFAVVLVYQPHEAIDNFRWVLSKNRNISEEKFGSAREQHRRQVDWISGVDQHGVLHLWRLIGVPTAAPTIEETGVCIQVNAADEHDRQHALATANAAAARPPDVEPLSEICIMAYFSQDNFDVPSALDVILQRADSILLSYNVAVAHTSLRPQVKRKSWYRSHIGAIAALAAHPSLPLIASVGVSETTRDADNAHAAYEILIFWISFSAFSAESRLIPSGVLQCARECGAVLSVQWVPTLHFDATPLLLVAFASGTIEVYGRTANAPGVVSSPKARRSPSSRRHFGRVASVAPWTFFDYSTGESGAEYEVVFHKSADAGVGFAFEKQGSKLIVTQLHSKRSVVDHVSLGDELVGVNHHSLVGKSPAAVHALLDAIPVDEILVARFRVKSARAHGRTADDSGGAKAHSATASSPTVTSTDDEAEAHSMELHNSFVSTLRGSGADHEHARVVPAADVSMYGGWRQLLRAQVASSLALLCVCPVYADDGEYAANTVLLFGVTSLPGTLSAWKGVQTPSSKAYELTPLRVEHSAIALQHDITSIAGERDYRQRAFSSKQQGQDDAAPAGLNSLLFVGNAAGAIQHWRCQLAGDALNFTLMSTCSVDAPPATEASVEAEASAGTFYRRGYVDHSIDQSATPKRHGTHHIEVDDPNRIAVLDTGEPETLHIYEAESGLGIMRLEESIASAGRGRILGFCWCNAHVEFNVDVLAVHYVASIVLYQYDMSAHRWIQIGDDIVTPYAIFDCTRDSSALLIGGGFLKATSASARALSTAAHTAVSNEMPNVLGKWDEPGTLLQYSMDWKAAESPQKLPVWHPYVLLTTLFGMHARVGVKDTQLAGDQPAYEFSRAFKDAVEMLKLLAKVIDDKVSAQVSVRSGVLSYSTTRHANGSTGSTGRRDSVGRYSTAVQTQEMSKAEHLFGDPTPSGSSALSGLSSDDLFARPPSRVSSASLGRLDKTEATVISDALDAARFRVQSSPYHETGSLLFAAFDDEHFVEMQAILHYVEAIQSLGFDMDASGADLGAKRFFSSHTFAKSLKRVLLSATTTSASSTRREESGNGAFEEPTPASSDRANVDDHTQWVEASLDESPSSGILWALHSDAQQFLLDTCVSPQATWSDLRPMWLGLWVKNTKDLRGIIERLAKSTFARTREAMDVCLLYVALGKKNVLSALAKISKADQDKKLALFLDHDFAQERWCNAAVKNAYSLLSKKQYETAAAFFLLCEPPRLQEALRVLTVRLTDPSLALVVARLVEYRTNESFQQDFISSTSLQHDVTSADAVTRQLLEHDIVPFFRAKNDRWMESCALWWLEDFEQASTVLLPLSQAVDAVPEPHECAYHPLEHHARDANVRCKAVVHFYVNLTSIPIYFQYLHSSANSALLLWATKKIQRRALVVSSSPAARRKLATTADIEHAFSFAAYACKRNGLSDTALVEMLQARHLVNVHARFELRAAETSSHSSSSADALASVSPPRVRASMRNLTRLDVKISPFDRSPWSASPRRMSDMHQLDLSAASLSSASPGDRAPFVRANTTNLLQLLQQPAKATPPAPWLKAQIADIECRRWSSSAFVGKMVGIRVAREMISHFRAELDLCFRHFDPTVEHFRAEPHKEFLEELCAPLCQQFQVDRDYVVEAALGVLQPHAYLHIVEVCFLLSELGRAATLCKWIQYVSLSMLHSCSTFASCTITDDIYRDWEGLTIQLCYLLNLDAQGQLQLPNKVVAQVAVAVRTGCIFLSWCRHDSRIIHEAILAPFFVTTRERAGLSDDEYFAELSMFSFEQSVRMVRQLQTPRDASDAKTWNFAGTFGYTFLETVAAHLSGSRSSATGPSATSSMTTREKLATHWRKLRKMYTLILMVSILRTHYARCQVFLSDFHGSSSADDSVHGSSSSADERDISSSLFTPRKMWKFLEAAPLDGIKRWYSLMESHLRCEFDYSVKHVTCLCGLYGLDSSVLKLTELQRSAAVHHDRVLKDPDSSRAMEHRLRADIVEPSGDSESPDSEGERRHHHHHHHHRFHLPHLHVRHHLRHLHHAHERCDLHSFLRAIGMTAAMHAHLVATSDDYVLLLMQHARFGVATRLRRFRVDPRVHVQCFLVQDAFDWFAASAIFATADACHAFLKRCCKARKLRLLIQQAGQTHHPLLSSRHESESDRSSSPSGSVTGADAQSPSVSTGDTASPAPLAEAASPDESGSGSSSRVSEKLLNEAMMFVSPWEVEAVENALRYMHKMHAPRHVELGWDRLSPICTETCDDVIATVFRDPELVEMWKATCGEGWLVTSITQYQLDGGYAPRSSSTDCCGSRANSGSSATGTCSSTCGDPDTDDAKVPYLVEIHARAQRNAMFREVGLPHRFVGYLTVSLIEGRDLIPCGWILHTSDPYVFLELASNSRHGATADSWSIDTHRSRVGDGGVNPRWGTRDDEFSFRFALPTHHVHMRSGASPHGPIENAWQADPSDEATRAAHGLESLFQAMYTGPPIVLNCSVYHKSTLLPHDFMGKGKVALTELTSGHPIDCWVPLDEVPKGVLHLRLALSFRLMCSSIAGAQEIDDILER